MEAHVRRTLGWAVALAAAGTLLAGSAEAQEDDRWLPWLGCWVSVEAPSEAPMLCVLPADGGVELRRVMADGASSSRLLLADGIERPTTVEGCAGTESAVFSEDGRRVFVTSSMTCGEVERESRGIVAMADPYQWIESEAVVIAGQSVGWVRRYRPAPAARVEEAGLGDFRATLEDRAMAVEAARVAAAAPLSVDDIIEASRETDAEAVRGWIAEQGEPVELDADRLIRLADAGVPPEVIDVAIATSYPERFQLARAPEVRQRIRPNAYMYLDPWGYDSWYRYSRYDRYFGYGYLGFPGYYGYPTYGTYHRPTVIVVQPAGSSGGGRVVNGRGYRRGTASAGGTTGRTAKPIGVRSSAGSRGSSSARSSESARPSSSGKTSKGKAKPRGGG